MLKEKGQLAKVLLVALTMICCGLRAFAQGTSNQGKDFWTAYMTHDLPAGTGSSMALYITSDYDTKGNISLADGSYSRDFTVKPRQLIEIKMPLSSYIKESGTYLKGIHITSQKKIAVYGHIFAQNVSGATLILPVNALGKNYYSINYTQQANKDKTYSSFMVIATEDNTTVEIVPSNNLLDGHKLGEPFQLTLQKGELYEGLSSTDLTRTTIRSVSNGNGDCKRIAVFSGSTRLSIGCTGNTDFSSDNLFQQVYPTASWGKNYITVPLKGRDYDVFRILLDDPNTHLKINGRDIAPDEFDIPTLYEFRSSEPNLIEADKPIQVVQYAVTQGRTNTADCQFKMGDIGDPEMIFLTPLEQTLDHVTLNSTGNFAITTHFVNVTIKTSAVNSFTVDGSPYAEFQPLTYDKRYSFAQIGLNAGVHTLNASDGFSAIAYGFGQHESYGYAGGANLADLNQNVVLTDPGNGEVHLNACSSTDYKLQLTLPYMTGQIKWSLDNGDPVVTDNDPKVIKTIDRDGKQLYLYEYAALVRYKPGDYTVTATVLDPVADQCGSTRDIDFDFTVTDLPAANFTLTGACEGQETHFTDVTNAGNGIIKSWHWDFGDGTTSNDANPVHRFLSNSTYKVVLTVANEAGCTSSTTKDVTISRKPEAHFDTDAAICAKKETFFTDHSVALGAPITTWRWDFGDNTEVVTRTNAEPFSHVFAEPGTYTITMTALTGSGCESDPVTLSVEVHPGVFADMGTPAVCLSDAYAQFINKTVPPEGDNRPLTYLWNFGDALATPADPNTSTEKDPRHKYKRVGEYTATLTVTTADGCPFTTAKSFTVNGDDPAAKFDVVNANKLCSSQPVTFIDRSTVNFGNITKVIWYYDHGNAPGDKEEFAGEDLSADHRYVHAYPAFGSPAIKKITVRMEAYSGTSCFDIFEQEITLLADPDVKMKSLGQVCYSAAPVQLITDAVGDGTGVFSGKGVTSAGMFDPKKAGVGTTTITYTYLAANGCEHVSTQEITVLPSPSVNAGEDAVVLEGGSVILKPDATGDGLVYRWSPATGIDDVNSKNPVLSPVEDGIYTLTVTNADGCSATDDVSVTILKNLTVNNTFTPNGDGVNDTWTVKYLETYPGNTVNIYNRYGEKVYSSVGYRTPWDGTYQGKALPTGTYYYIIDPKNGRKPVSGSVTIIR